MHVVVAAQLIMCWHLMCLWLLLLGTDTHSKQHMRMSEPDSLWSHCGTDDVIHLWCDKGSFVPVQTHTQTRFFSLCAAHVSGVNRIERTCVFSLQEEAAHLSFVCRLIHHAGRTVRAAVFSRSHLPLCKAL